MTSNITQRTRAPRTLYSKIWDEHVIREMPGGETLLAIDRHLINEVTSPQAFEGLRRRGLSVLRPSSSLAVADHNVPTDGRDAGVAGIGDEDSRVQVETLERNVLAFGVPYIPLRSKAQGIVHVIGPELGLTLPGTTVVCGDSHTSTHGAFGALAFGIGTSEVEHVLATQSLVQRRAKTMLVDVVGRLRKGTSAKDLVLAIIGKIGTAGATGHVIEYAGSGMTALDMAGRMTVCNMSIEAGARAGLMAPDERTFEYLRGRRYAPRNRGFGAACDEWRRLATDTGAEFDARVEIDGSAVVPMVTWGTTPEAVISLDGRIPDPAVINDVSKRAQAEAMLTYMGLKPGRPLAGTPIDVAFIGSCTNGRLEDLRDAAAAVRGRRVAPHVRALVVPGSGAVKADAEREGLDRVFIDAGFEWRDAGCSMCLGMNADRLMPGERCASSSNRNFEGRQGPGGRTHLMSPALVAIAAVIGAIPTVESLNE